MADALAPKPALQAAQLVLAQPGVPRRRLPDSRGRRHRACSVVSDLQHADQSAHPRHSKRLRFLEPAGRLRHRRDRDRVRLEQSVLEGVPGRPDEHDPRGDHRHSDRHGAGTLIGIGRLSRNFLLRGVCTAYVELFRNIPVLLQLLMWYLLLNELLPPVIDALNPAPGMYLSKGGFAFPVPVWAPGIGLIAGRRDCRRGAGVAVSPLGACAVRADRSRAPHVLAVAGDHRRWRRCGLVRGRHADRARHARENRSST